MGALRDVLDPWFGKPQWNRTEARVTFIYRFDSDVTPEIRLRLKIEINSRAEATRPVNRTPAAFNDRFRCLRQGATENARRCKAQPGNIADSYGRSQRSRTSTVP
jgi:hypothetical protein